MTWTIPVQGDDAEGNEYVYVPSVTGTNAEMPPLRTVTYVVLGGGVPNIVAAAPETIVPPVLIEAEKVATGAMLGSGGTSMTLLFPMKPCESWTDMVTWNGPVRQLVSGFNTVGNDSWKNRVVTPFKVTVA